MRKISYEKPTLNKYGTMKELTLGSSGSIGDSFGSADPSSVDNVSNNKTDISPFSGIDVTIPRFSVGNDKIGNDNDDRRTGDP